MTVRMTVCLDYLNVTSLRLSQSLLFLNIYNAFAPSQYKLKYKLQDHKYNNRIKIK